MSGSSSGKISHLVSSLAGCFGEIAWWPGYPDEVMIGAVLTQQTRWEHVERALHNLQKRNICSIDSIFHSDIRDIEDAIRCTGFYHVKAKRLKSLATYVMKTCGGVETMADIPTGHLRLGLLTVSGIGEETADSILCYALDRTSFVIDAYTERIVRCIGVPEKKQDLKALFEENLPEDNHSYRQVHAHIVEYAKEYCGKKRCQECILLSSSG
jgi:endonuclease-3 related protein